jgi:4-carboxymuconolactone decarboxylase
MGVIVMPSNERLQTGLAIRREVLGSETPDATTEWSFAKPYLDLVTEYVYGAVWARPGLTRRDRSLLNLAMFAALNRSQELTLHIGLALNNGLTPEEIREVFMQVGVYCGAPAGLTGFRAARQVFEKRGVGVSGAQGA